MKKKLNYIIYFSGTIIACIFIVLFYKQKQGVAKQSNIAENVIFNEFINGTRKAYFDDSKKEGIDINFITSPLGESERHYDSAYTIVDSNGDGKVELHIKSSRYYFILICRENELYIWSDLYPQSELLDNGDFLYTHLGGAPDHRDYTYYMLDNKGEIHYQISFSWYDVNDNEMYDNEDIYTYDKITDMTKDMWIKITERYLNVSKNDAMWVEI